MDKLRKIINESVESALISYTTPFRESLQLIYV